MRELFLVHRDEMTVLDGHAALDHGVVHRSAHADRAEDAGGIEAGADQLKAAGVDHKEVAALADLEHTDVVAAAEQARAAARRHLQHVIAAGGRLAGVQAVEQECDAQFLHETGAVVGGGAVDAEADGNAKLQHLGDAGDARGELHVGNGAVAHARAGLGEDAQLLVVEVDAVGEPDVVAGPAETLHVLERADALTREHEVFFILRLAQVGVQTHTELTGEDGAFTQQVGADGERRAGRERDAVHCAEAAVMVLRDDALGILHDLVDRLHHAVRRQAAVLHREVHAAAGGVHTDAQLVRGAELRAEQVAGVLREDVVMVEAGRAAVLHQLAHAGEGGETDDFGVEVLPDLVERLEPVEQLHVLHLGEVAGEDLIEVMVRVDQTGVAEHMARVDGFVGLAVEFHADLLDEAVLGVKVDVFVHGVGAVAGDERADIFDE